MSDILERLRTVDGCTQKTFMHRLDWVEGRLILSEAAAEIERLRAVVRVNGLRWGSTHAEIDALLAARPPS